MYSESNSRAFSLTKEKTKEREIRYSQMNHNVHVHVNRTNSMKISSEMDQYMQVQWKMIGKEKGKKNYIQSL